MRRRIAVVTVGAAGVLGFVLPGAQAEYTPCPDGTVAELNLDVQVNDQGQSTQVCLPPAAP